MTNLERDQLLSMSRQAQSDPPLRLSTHELLCKVLLEMDTDMLDMERVITLNRRAVERSVNSLWRSLIVFQLTVIVIFFLSWAR